RADETDLVAAQDDGGEVADHRPAAEALRDVLRLHDDLAGCLAPVERDAGAALHLAARAEFLAHALERAHAPLVARTARLDALTDPGFFLRQLLVELLVGLFLGRQLLFAEGQEAAVVVAPAVQVAAGQLPDTVGDLLQEGAVVGDQDDG